MLSNTGLFAVVDKHDASASASGAAPTASQLAQYDALLVWADISWIVTIGNLLADFWDSQGDVVLATCGASDKNVGGRFGTLSNGYMLMEVVGGDGAGDSMGKILEADSPLVQGVASLSAPVTYRSTGGVVNGSVVVARWAAGQPLVVRGDRGDRGVVALNFYPAPLGYPYSWNECYWQGWSGNGGNLMRNALLYSTCRKCRNGTYAGAGASNCSPCPAGTYSNTGAGATACTRCSGGTFATAVGATSYPCVVCGAGKFSPAGSTFCQYCHTSTFSTAIGADSCIPLLQGSGPCEMGNLSWPEVISREENTSYTGGLGNLMTVQQQVWVCLVQPSLPAACGGSGAIGAAAPSGRGAADLACYTFNEEAQRFAYWGPNRLLQLV